MIAKFSGLILFGSMLMLPYASSSAESADSVSASASGGPLSFSATLATATASEQVGQPVAARGSKIGLTAQNAAVEVLFEISEQTRDTYVGSGVELDESRLPTGRYWINFTTEPPAWVQEELAAQAFPTVVTWGFSANAGTLSDLVESLAGKLNSDPSVVHYDVGASVGLGLSGIDIQLVPDEGHKAEDLAQAAVDAVNADNPTADTSARGTSSAEIPVIFAGASDSSQAFNADIRGGESTSGCTLGFTANCGDQSGALTASHCSAADWSYNGQYGILAQPTLDALGQWWDVQLNPRSSANHTVSRLFRSSNSAFTEVTGVVAGHPGQTVCKYGQVTARDCAAITQVDRCTTFSSQVRTQQYQVCHAYRMDRAITTHGDSGGPWFVNGTAYGTTIGAGDESCFTGAWEMSQLGIHIRRA